MEGTSQTARFPCDNGPPPPAPPAIVSVAALLGGVRLSVQFDHAMENVPVDPANWVWQVFGESNWFGTSFVMWRTESLLWIDGTAGALIPDDNLASYLATVHDVRSALLVP